MCTCSASVRTDTVSNTRFALNATELMPWAQNDRIWAGRQLGTFWGRLPLAVLSDPPTLGLALADNHSWQLIPKSHSRRSASVTSAPANKNRKLCSQISAFLVFRLMADCCHCRLLLIPSKYLRVSSIVVSHECESARSSCSPFSGKINIPNITIFFKQGLQVLKYKNNNATKPSVFRDDTGTVY